MERLILCMLLIVASQATAQYAGDNLRYTNIPLEQVPAALEEHPDALLLDVRSPGEYHDTSHYASLNIGRLKGSVNIPIDSIHARYRDLLPYRNKPILVYCSHSQRSRQVSNLLSDSGFTQLINVNAGLSRYWQEHHHMAAVHGLVQRDRPDGLVSAAEFCALMAQGALAIDLRADTAFGATATLEAHRSLGTVQGAIHIPFGQLEKRIREIPDDRTLVLVDEQGAEAPSAAALLFKAGRKQVHALFGGLETMRDTDPDHFPCAGKVLDRPLPYKILPIARVDVAAITAGRSTIVDIRSPAEFEGRAERPWLNVGRLRGAINIPKEELLQGAAKGRVPMEAHVLVMGRDSEDYYEAARSLCEQGYMNVTVLDGGIWNLRWTAHNLPAYADLEHLMEPPKKKGD